MLYEVLTGQHPFPNITGVERMFKHLNEPIPLIDTLDPEYKDAVNAIIQKSTQKNPIHRYADVLEMAAEFRQAMTGRQQPSDSDVVALLTMREQEILQCILDGLSNRQIAEKLFVTIATVKWYIKQIYKKLGVRSRVQAIVRARELKLVVPSGDDDDLTVIKSATSISQLPEPENPYKGLQAFQSADEQDFFGREKLTQKIIQRLEEKDALARFLAIVGPSGSGKSSLTKAGLIPALWRGDLPDSERWFIVDMLPGSHPMDKLEVALMRVAANQADSLHEQLSRDKRGLLRVADLILPDDGSELVLIIDQFEEVFTFVEDEDQRSQFLDLLHAAVTEKRSRVRVVVTLRADFYDRPLMYPGFGELMRHRTETVLPLSAKELERAIVNPAKRVGVVFEEGLVATIASEVSYQPGALPLLQYALTELFEQRDNRTLTQAAYQDIGGTVGALAKRAETLYHELSAEGQAITQQVFLRLVTLGEGVEDTRRRALRSELAAIAPDEDLLNEVIDAFAEYRLLSLDHDTDSRAPMVEVAHEAMLREWERLRNWLNESRDDVRMQRQLASMAEEWSAAGQDRSFLLRGSRLEMFEGWGAITELASTPQESNYLAASLAERERQAKIEHERKAREMSLEQRSRKVLQALVGVFLVAAILSGALALLALNREQQANDERDNAQNARDDAATQAAIAEANAATAEYNEAQAQSLVWANAAEDALAEGNYDLALPMALGAASIEDPPLMARDALITVNRANPRLRIFVGHEGPVYNVAFSPDGQTALSASGDNTLILWDVNTGEIILIFTGHTEEVINVAFSPDGQTALSSASDNTLILWDVNTGQMIRTFIGHQDPVTGMVLSPNGQQVLSSSFTGEMFLWDVSSGEILRTFNGEGGWVAFNPGGQAAWSNSGNNVILWEVSSGEILRTLNVEGGWRAVSPDGQMALSVSEDNTLVLWDVNTGQPLRTFASGQTLNIFGVAFSPDGTRVLSSSADNPIILWDVASGEIIRIFTGHTLRPDNVVFSPDGQTALSASRDGTLILWDVTDRQTIQSFMGHTSRVHSLQYSLDGTMALSGAADDTLILWDVDSGEPIRTFTGHQGDVLSVDFSPTGTKVLSGSLDDTLILWDVSSGEAIQAFTGHTDDVTSVKFSPNGETALSGSADDTLILWDVNSGQIIRSFTGHTDDVTSVDFSPNGRERLGYA